MLSFRNISFSYSQKPSFEVLSDISCTISPRDFFVLVGSNGSGKSSFAQLCNGLHRAQKGEVIVDGIRLRTASPEQLRQVRSLVGLVKQDPESQILSSTVFEEVGFGPCNLGLSREEVYQRIADALECCDLIDLADRNPATLSGGEQQRLVLASVIALKPRYIVLDEPCAMLDPHSRAKIMDLVVKLHHSGVGIILITHDLSDLRFATRVGTLIDGQLTLYDHPEAYLHSDHVVAQTGCARSSLMRCARSLSDLFESHDLHHVLAADGSTEGSIELLRAGELAHIVYKSLCDNPPVPSAFCRLTSSESEKVITS